MPTSNPDPSERRQRLNQVIAAYVEAKQAGNAPERDELLGLHPDLATELAAFFADQDRLQTMVKPPPTQTAAPALVHALPHFTSEAATVAAGDAQFALAGTRVRYFGDYEVMEETARGGMGVVYRARQISLNRTVALKMILTGQLASAADVQRFRHEAEAAANLDHPNIVPIYEVGEHEGQHYFSMRFIEGGSLARAIGDGKWPALSKDDQRQSAELVASAARAVHHAHQRGILHRDLKPGNILLDLEGMPQVTDFGLAKRADSDSGMTGSGAIVGTPSYMAPEQARSERSLSTAVDVYSLGAVLYELVTGQPPFRAATPLDTVLQVLDHPPARPRTLNPRLDHDLETVCLKCLEKNAARRYPSAQALAEELERWLAGEPIQARPATAWERTVKWAKRRPAAAALVAVSILATTALFVLGLVYDSRLQLALQDVSEQQRSVRDLKTQAQEHEAAARRASLRAQDRLGQAFVADGAKHLERGEWWEALVLFVEALRVDHGDRAREEEHRIRLGWMLRQCPRLVQVIEYKENIKRATFSEDGRQLLMIHFDNTMAISDVMNGTTRQLPVQLPKDHDIHDVMWSPDGAHFLLVVGQARDIAQRESVWIQDTRGCNLVKLMHEKVVRYAAFSSDGKRIVTASNDGAARLWEASTGRLMIPPCRHKDVVNFARLSSQNDRLLTCSRDGTAALWETSSGRQLLPPLKHAGPVFLGDFSPDGNRLVTVSNDSEGRKTETRIWDVRTGKLLTPPMRQDGSSDSREDHFRSSEVHFSSDGRLVLVVNHRGQADDVVIWDAATGLKLPRDFAHPSGVGGAVFSADGRYIVTANSNFLVPEYHPSGDNTSCVWDIATGRALTPHLLPAFPQTGCATFSPNGRFVMVAGGTGPLGGPLMPGKGEALVWDLAGIQYGAVVREWQGELADVMFSRDNRRLAVVMEVPKTEERVAFVCDATSLEPVTGPLRHRTSFVMEFNNDGKLLATGTDDGTVTVWDAQTGKPLTQPIEHAPHISQLSFTGDSKRLLTVSLGSPARVWDVNSGRLLNEFGAQVCAAGFSPDGKTLVTASRDGTAQVWDCVTGKPITTALKHDGELAFARFSPDGGRVVTVTNKWQCEARIWDVRTGTAMTPPLPHDTPIEFIRFSRDGQVLFTTTSDKLTRRWTGGTAMSVDYDEEARPTLPSSGRCLTPPSNVVTDIPLGPEVYNMCTNQPITFWLRSPIRSGVDGFRFVETIQGFTSAELSPDGGCLIAAKGNRLWKWDLVPDPRPIEDLVQLVQLMAGKGVTAAGKLVKLSSTEMDQSFEALRRKHSEEFSPASAQEQRRWHQSQVASGEQDRDWSAARWHAWKLAAMSLRDGAWGEAIRWCAKGMALYLEEPFVLRRTALGQLSAGNMKGYLETCRRLRENLGITPEAPAAWRVLLLAPGVDMENLPGAWGDNRYSSSCDGAASYRRGDFQGAIQYLQDSLKAHDSEGTPWDWFFLAMAHKQLGHRDEARRWYQDAVQVVNRSNRADEEGIVLDLLRKEAEAVLKGKPAPTEADDKRQRPLPR